MSGSYRAGSVLPIHLRSFCWGTDDGRKVCEKENRINEKILIEVKLKRQMDFSTCLFSNYFNGGHYE